MAALERPALRIALCAALCGLGALAGAPATAVAAPVYSVKRAPYRADARFVVTYTGSAVWGTTWHATPPNQGGNPDTNDGHDVSGQGWRLRFSKLVAIPACGPHGPGGADPCAGLTSLGGAKGPTGAIGDIDHRHVDGLYRQLDAAERCRVVATTPPKERVDAHVRMRYFPAARAIAVTAFEPVSTVLLRLPQTCPNRGDSIDGFIDNYFMPGFSFDPTYGPARWFRARTIAIPAKDFHHAAKLTIPLRDTRAGRSPAHCAVLHPEYEHCSTGGAWTGDLTFRALAP